MRMRNVFAVLMSMALGCSAAAPGGATIGDVVTNLVQHARRGDQAFFTLVAKGPAAEIMSMVQRSGMETNFVERLQKKSDSTARLDYHMLERGCHFQVDLRKDTNWVVASIWLCR